MAYERKAATWGIREGREGIRKILRLNTRSKNFLRVLGGFAVIFFHVGML
jgi:hypothetical protein